MTIIEEQLLTFNHSMGHKKSHGPQIQLGVTEVEKIAKWQSPSNVVNSPNLW
jgi:hypothetical protein